MDEKKVFLNHLTDGIQILDSSEKMFNDLWNGEKVRLSSDETEQVHNAFIEIGKIAVKIKETNDKFSGITKKFREILE